MTNELPTLTPGSGNVQPNPLMPNMGNLNIGITPMMGRYSMPNSGTNTGPAPIRFGGIDQFSAAVNTNAADYDKIMAMYNDIAKGGSAIPQINMTPITPQLNKRTDSLRNDISNLSGIAGNGGLSGTDVANIRARGVSPIRSVYANAQRNLDRNRALQGGYSPNYGALTAKMAREMSEQVGQANTNVEAGIAELISRNKLAALPTMASLASEDARLQSANDTSNTDIMNRTNEGNRLMQLQVSEMNTRNINDAINHRLSGMEGMRNLLGTTPALTNMFGNQVMQGQQLQQSAQQIQQQQQAALAQLAASIAAANSGKR